MNLRIPAPSTLLGTGFAGMTERKFKDEEGIYFGSAIF